MGRNWAPRRLPSGLQALGVPVRLQVVDMLRGLTAPPGYIGPPSRNPWHTLGAPVCPQVVAGLLSLAVPFGHDVMAHAGGVRRHHASLRGAWRQTLHKNIPSQQG